MDNLGNLAIFIGWAFPFNKIQFSPIEFLVTTFKIGNSKWLANYSIKYLACISIPPINGGRRSAKNKIPNLLI